MLTPSDKIDRLISEKENASSDASTSPNKPRAAPAESGRFASDFDFLSTRPIEELKSRKTDMEQRIWATTERQQRLTQIREEQKKKRDELEAKQAELVNLEDRIGLALNTRTNQYIYRTSFRAMPASSSLRYSRLLSL